MAVKINGLAIRVVIAIFLPHAAIAILQNTIGPLAPFLQEDLGISRTQVGLFTSVQYFGTVLLSLPCGVIIERLGIRPFILITPLILGLGTVLFAGVSSYYQGLLIFTVSGLSYGFVNPATTKAVLLNFAPDRRGTAAGIKQTGIPVGVFFAAATLPAIAVAASWRVAMIFAAAVAMLSGLAGWLLYRGGDDGITPAPQGAAGRAVLADAARLLKDRDFNITNVLQGTFTAAQMIIQYYIVLYLVEVVQLSRVGAGFMAASIMLIGAASRIAWGMVSDFCWGGRRVPVLLLIGLVTVAGLLMLSLISAAAPTWIIWLAAAAVGSGSIGFMGIAILLRAELVGKEQAATATGLGMSFSFWGAILGPPLFGFIVDTTQSYRLAWSVLAAVCLASLALLPLVRDPARPLARPMPASREG